jgi:hypothetical protein
MIYLKTISIYACTPKPPSAKALAAETPVDFFKLYFDEKVMQNIVTQTNLYGQQNNTTLNMSMDELRCHKCL